MKKKQKGLKISNQQYRKGKGISSSELKVFYENPLRYKLILDGLIDVPDTSSLKIGRAIHESILEPELFEQNYVFLEKKPSKRQFDYLMTGYEEIPEQFLTPSGMLSKKQETVQKYNEWLEEIEGEPVLPDQYRELVQIEQYKDKIIMSTAEKEAIEIAHAHTIRLPGIQKILDSSIKEMSYYAELNGGLICKCRPDIIYAPNKDKPDEVYVIDVKSTETDANSKNFQRNSVNFSYWLQEAHYRRVLEANGYKVLSFQFVFVSTKIEGGVTYQSHVDLSIDAGLAHHFNLIDHFVWSQKNNTYSTSKFNGKGYDVINTVNLPPYVFD